MDSRLNDRLRKWDEQIVTLKKAEEVCLGLEANEKALEGSLYLTAPVQFKTVNERESWANSHEDMRNFRNGLAAAKAAYNHEKRVLELRIKAYEAEYGTFRKEADIIQRGKGGHI